MKFKIIFLLVLGFTSLFSQKNCYTIAVGKKASYDQKRVFIAHNEDDAGDMIINMFKIPSKTHSKKDTYNLVDSNKISQIAKTNALIWIETTQQNFGDMFMNEYGVTICSDACQSKEENTPGILTYDFRRLMAERAKSAKEAIMIAASLLKKYGYGSSGRTYTIADANQVWLLSVVMGNHWVAQRVPDDEVAIIPNYYTIGEIDLNDTNILASPDIITYAIKRKWYNPDLGKPFNFREAYSAETVLHTSWNVPRHWIGLQYLSEKKYNIDDTFPFSFIPKTKISLDDLKFILSNHYEDTDLETNKKLHTNPHNNLIHSICNQSTKFSVIADLTSINPKNNTNILWFAPLNPCIFPFIPISFDIETFPDMYKNVNSEKAKLQHFDKEKTSFKNNPKQAFTVFNNYRKKINTNYWSNSQTIQKLKQEYHNIIITKPINKELSYELLLKLYNSSLNL